MLNAMTVDVEEYFQVSAFSDVVKRSEWPNYESRVRESMDRILGLFESHDMKATFFILGWIARQHPQLVKQIHRQGHEVASHGMYHERVTELTSQQFSTDLIDSRMLLEDITGAQVKGYRAPSFSLPLTTQSYEILADAGYRYSSSVYPIKHDHYGEPNAERFNFEGGSGVLEVPISTLRILGRNFPAGGGGFFRLLPYHYHKMGFSRLNKVEGKAGVFYMHPWEIDAEQPRPIGISAKGRFRHYLNLKKTYGRLARLLDDYVWSSIEQVYQF
ncbi:XrtA system polysaccharide deacetylase [Aestuariirhabdus sp. LZHN29]|uniref:XrtA system polysaccharide deacetylase n=1 Tax=Aestuariirhabdus sp. LZHN29 TaxID=3417462 RepID=UPI003CFAE8EC